MNKLGLSPTVHLDYESTHNLFYIEIYPTIQKNTGFGSRKTASYVDGSKTSNIAIYDVVHNSTSYLFEPDTTRNIVLFLFEKEFNLETKTILFNTNTNSIINNQKIKQRPPKDQLLVLIQNKEKEVLEFWTANKQGANKTLIKTIHQKTIWKLDVLNQKILFIKQLDNKIEIDAIDW